MDTFGVRSVARDGQWPRPGDLWGRNMYNDALLFESAPFLTPAALRDAELIQGYTAATGELPGGLSLAAVTSRDFTHRLVVEPELLRPEFRLENTRARVAFVELIRQRMRRTPCNRLVPRAWDLYMWAYRTEADRVFVAGLKRVMDNLRIREEEAAVELMAWSEAILPPGFESQPDRRRDPPMHNKLKYERRMRNRMGFFVAYEWVEATSFERDVLTARYPELPAWFAQYEVPADLLTELPPCLVYYGMSMMADPQSLCWMVFLSTVGGVPVRKLTEIDPPSKKLKN